MIPNMSFCVKGSCLWLFFLLSTTEFDFADSWGREGHEIVANLAWKMLENSTRAKIESILDINTTDISSESHHASANICCDCSPLAVVADWADAVRHTKAFSWSAPLHFIDVHDEIVEGGCPADVPNSLCSFNYTRDCKNDVCVAGATVNYTQLVYNLHSSSGVENNGTRPLLRESLKFLTHFVGDIHQPLHASRASDRGGNSIHVHFALGHLSTSENRTPSRSLRRKDLASHHHEQNLHAVWDSSIIDKCLYDDFQGSRLGLEDHLWEWMNNNNSTPLWKSWLTCPYGGVKHCTKRWGEESFERAIEFAYRNVDGTEIADGTTLTEAYYVSRLPIVKERLVAGGVRLAITLQIALEGEDYASELWSTATY